MDAVRWITVEDNRMPPGRGPRIPDGVPSRLVLAMLAGACCLFPAPAASGQVLDTTLWAANAEVQAILRSGNTIYLGGRFTEVGPVTGSGVAIEYPGGTVVSGFPKVTGFVHAAAPDGAGGWYIGGAFSAVNGIPRRNAAHILADLTVSAWDPDVGTTSASRVNSIAVFGDKVFIGGQFNTAGGQTRNHIAALDRVTGQATPWDANANTEVHCVAAGATTLFAAGRFGSIGGAARNRIAELDTSLGQATGWNPNASLDVDGVTVRGSTVYAYGSFGQIGGQTRPYVAALDAATGLATSWNPRPNGRVRALVASNGVVYIGGDFTNFFVNAPRNYIAAVDSVTGLATPWNPNAGGGPFNGTRIRALALNGPALVAGGAFMTIGGQARSYLAALDTATAQATAWDPHAGSEVATVAAAGSTVFAGGFFVSMNGVTRQRIAALDAATGAATAWNPNANGTVNALAAWDGTLYALGEFTSIGGQFRQRIAALDMATGLATGWNPVLQSTQAAWTYDVAANASSVFLAGDFSFYNFGGEARTDLGALDRASAQAYPWWDPRPVDGANNAVHTLLVDGSRLYIGGDFGYVGGMPRSNIAALDTLTSQADFTWDPGADNDVLTLAATPGTLYAGGVFTSIGGQPRNRLAALDPLTGLATAWNPDVNGPIFDLALGDGLVCAVGQFTSVGGQPSFGAVALDAATGQVLNWLPDPSPGSASFLSVEVAGNTVYLGGSFTRIDGRPVGCFAAYQFPATTGVPSATDRARVAVRAWPNPFVEQVAIAFDLPSEQRVRLEVLDVAGRRVWTSPEHRLGAGPRSLAWDGRHAARAGEEPAEGIYFVRVVGEDFQASRRVVRLSR